MTGRTCADLRRLRRYGAARRPRLGAYVRSVASITTSRGDVKDAIPYSIAALRQDLSRLADEWASCQASRKRSAIYNYLRAVFDLVARWDVEGHALPQSRRAVRCKGLKIWEKEDSYSA